MRHPTRIAALCACACVVAAAARGQSADRPAAAGESETPQPEDVAPPPNVEEVIVYAQRAVPVVLDSSVSLTSFDQEYLEALGASDIRDISKFTPNLEIKSANAASNPTIFIRGVGLDDARANASSSVAILQDDVYMNSPAGMLGQFFDVSRVEVLRGPQGTFYGRNASAGAILIESNKPSGETAAQLTGTYGTYDAMELEGFLDFPLVPTLLATRLSGRVNKRDGLVENRCAIPASFSRALRTLTRCPQGEQGFSAGSEIEHWVNDVDNWSARGQLRFQPLDGAMDWILNVHGSRNDSLATQFQVIGYEGPGDRTQVAYVDPDTCSSFVVVNGIVGCPPNSGARNPEDGDPYAGDYDQTGREVLDLFGGSLTGDWTLWDLTLKSISAYEWHARDTDQNLDGVPDAALEPNFNDSAYQLTQELRANWDMSPTVSLQLGGYFLYEDLDVFNTYYQPGVVAPIQDQTQQTTYYAGYLRGEWRVAEDLELEAGARVNHEVKDFHIVTDIWFWRTGTLGKIECDPGAPCIDVATSTVTAPSGDVVLRYLPTEELTFYGKYTRGFKGAHFNGAPLLKKELLIDVADPEYVDAIELGWKTHWLDDLVEWNGATYYYNYQNQQVFVNQVKSDGRSGTPVPVPTLINAADTRVAGIETDVLLRWEGLRSFTSFSYNFSEYTDFVNTVTRTRTDIFSGIVFTRTDVNNFSGNRLVAAPDFNVSGYLDYVWDLGRWGKLTPRFDYNWRSQVYFTPENEKRLGDDPRWLLHSRLAWEDADGRVEIALWMRNLLDEAYRLTAIDLTDPEVLGQVSYVFDEPRTYGVTLQLRF